MQKTTQKVYQMVIFCAEWQTFLETSQKQKGALAPSERAS
jgi:hypothetical protein